jgi:hypothetical protein
MKPFDEHVKAPTLHNSQKIFTSDIQKQPKVYTNVKKPYYVYNKLWYTKLISGSKTNKGLLDCYKTDDLVGHLVVCLNFLNKTGYLEYIYAFFDSYVDFFEYKKQFAPHHCSFYEVVNFNQKPHFDIDINIKDLIENYYPEQKIYYNDMVAEGNLLVETLIRAIKIIMMPNVLNLTRDVLVYTSHGNDKLSYHIIVDNWCHHDHLEAKSFHDKVVFYTASFLHGRLVEFIDDSVYKTNQNFRMLGSHKYNDKRTKVFQPEFLYRGQMIKHQTKNKEDKLFEMKEFSKSLITFTAECNLLQSFYKKKLYNRYNYDLSEQNVKDIEGLLFLHFKGAYTIREVYDSSILLTTVIRISCPICKRVHLHENPKLLIFKNEVSWTCRRTEERYFLGTLENMKYELITEQPLFTEDDTKDDDNTHNVLSFGDFEFDLTQDIDLLTMMQQDSLNNIKDDPVKEEVKHVITPLKKEVIPIITPIKKEEVKYNVMENGQHINTDVMSVMNKLSQTKPKPPTMRFANLTSIPW